MTNMSYATAYSEFSQNDQTIRHLGLTPYAVQNLVTPGITGLDNASVMQAAYDVGIRQLVSDTSVAGQDNPSPNAGIWNAFVPGILEIPRYPTDLDYDVSTPDEWTLADNDRDMKTQTYDRDRLGREPTPGRVPAEGRERPVDVPPGQHARLRRRAQPAG